MPFPAAAPRLDPFRIQPASDLVAPDAGGKLFQDAHDDGLAFGDDLEVRPVRGQPEPRGRPRRQLALALLALPDPCRSQAIGLPRRFFVRSGHHGKANDQLGPIAGDRLLAVLVTIGHGDDDDPGFEKVLEDAQGLEHVIARKAVEALDQEIAASLDLPAPDLLQERRERASLSIAAVEGGDAEVAQRCVEVQVM